MGEKGHGNLQKREHFEDLCQMTEKNIKLDIKVNRTEGFRLDLFALGQGRLVGSFKHGIMKINEILHFQTSQILLRMSCMCISHLPALAIYSSRDSPRSDRSDQAQAAGRGKSMCITPTMNLRNIERQPMLIRNELRKSRTNKMVHE